MCVPSVPSFIPVILEKIPTVIKPTLSMVHLYQIIKEISKICTVLYGDKYYEENKAEKGDIE